jgi:glycosyltransferase involved in cell wall biosynthesis
VLVDTVAQHGRLAPKILIFSGSAFTMGGMERIMQTLGRDLSIHGFSAEILLPNRHIVNDIHRWFLDNGVAPIKSEQLATLNETGFKAIFSFSRYLRACHASLVSLHSPGPHVPLAELLAARLAGLPTVISIHGHDPGHPTSQVHRWRNTLLGSPLSAKVVVPSETVMRQQEAYRISRAKLRLIYCGVPGPRQSLSRSEARLRLGLPSDSFIITSFGRLVPDKGIDTLIEAVNLLPDDLLTRLSVLIGGIGQLDALESLVSERARHTVRFLGQVSDTSSYYRASDIFVLPSRHEPFGMVFVEAALHGVPSIGTNVGGIPEAVISGTTGLLVDKDDPVNLAQHIVLLSQNDKLRLQLGEAALVRANELFRDTTMVENYANLFWSVLRRSKGW